MPKMATIESAVMTTIAPSSSWDLLSTSLASPAWNGPARADRYLEIAPPRPQRSAESRRI